MNTRTPISICNVGLTYCKNPTVVNGRRFTPKVKRINGLAVMTPENTSKIALSVSSDATAAWLTGAKRINASANGPISSVSTAMLVRFSLPKIPKVTGR